MKALLILFFCLILGSVCIAEPLDEEEILFPEDEGFLVPEELELSEELKLPEIEEETAPVKEGEGAEPPEDSTPESETNQPGETSDTTGSSWYKYIEDDSWYRQVDKE